MVDKRYKMRGKLLPEYIFVLHERPYAWNMSLAYLMNRMTNMPRRFLVTLMPLNLHYVQEEIYTCQVYYVGTKRV